MCKNGDALDLSDMHDAAEFINMSSNWVEQMSEKWFPIEDKRR